MIKDNKHAYTHTYYDTEKTSNMCVPMVELRGECMLVVSLALVITGLNSFLL